jgi:hypothetical protein
LPSTAAPASRQATRAMANTVFRLKFICPGRARVGGERSRELSHRAGTNSHVGTHHDGLPRALFWFSVEWAERPRRFGVVLWSAPVMRWQRSDGTNFPWIIIKVVIITTTFMSALAPDADWRSAGANSV